MSPDLTPIFAQLRAYKKSRVLAVALHRGVLGCLADGSRSPVEIAQSTGMHVDWLMPMLGVLAELGLVCPTGGWFGLTDLGREAAHDQALISFGGYHFHCFSAWDRLPVASRTGRGGNFHAEANPDPDFSRAYLESLDAIAQSNLETLRRHCGAILSGRVLDLAAGPATVMRKMAEANPELAVSALDLEPISRMARSLFETGSNFHWVAGDFWKWRPEEPFESVFCSHFLEYCGVGRIHEFLDRLSGFLTSCGEVIFVAFLRGEKEDSNLDLFELSTGLNGDALGHVFSAEEISDYLQAARFEIVSLQYLPCGPSYQEAVIHCRRSMKGHSQA